jgi:flagellar biogenesis protein FliO
MSNETEQKTTRVSVEDSQNYITIKKNGINLYGTLFPWWVVIIIVVLLIYVLRKLYISNKSTNVSTLPSTLTDSTPEEVRKLIGGTVYYY